MPLKLDWMIETDDGWKPIPEDPELVARREQRRWIMRVTTVLMGVVIIVAGLMYIA